MANDSVKARISLTGLKKLIQLYSFLRPYRLQYALGLLFLLGSSSASLVFPKLLGELITAANTGVANKTLTGITTLLIVVVLLQSVFSYFRVILFVQVAEKTLSDLRQAVYNHLVRLPVKFFAQRRVGELNSRLSSDITLLQDALTTTLAEFIRQVIVIFGGISLMMTISFRLTSFMLLIVPVIMILITVFGRYIRSLSKKAQKQIADSNTVVEETLQGIYSVKAFNNEYYEMRRYGKATKAIAHTGIINGKYRGAFSSFVTLGIFGTLVAVIWRGSLQIASGELATGELFSFVIYTVFIGGTIGGLADVFARVQKFIGATEDLLELFDEIPEPVAATNNETMISIMGNITLQDVFFKYPNRPDADVLRNINITIQADQVVALVGPSGAGKSTLTSLLLRLYEPTSGKILFDDHDSDSIPLSDLRSQIAIVPQDIFLFGGTIRENIAYGDTNATDEMIIHAAKEANAWEFIQSFPDKFDTIVGERGTQLSGGQRQRIAIARAILKNPRILILDEATSSLDSENERMVQQALERLMKGRTSIVIAHRLSTIYNADRILVFNKGELAEQGTHAELIQRKDGLYYYLYNIQFAE